MAFLDWFENFPPMGLDNGLKLLIYLLIIYTLLSALIVFLLTKKLKQTAVPSLLGIDTGDDEPISTDIPPAERITILKIEKAKNVAAQKTLSDFHRRKEVSDTIFNRLSVRYATEVQKMEEEIEKTTREVEVSQLEQELKKMQGDYLTKIKGDESKDTPVSAPPAPPAAAPAPPAPPAAAPAPPAAAPAPPGTAPAPPGTAPAPPGTAPAPPVAQRTAPTAAPPAPQGIPAPTAVVPKAPVTAQAAPSEEEGDLFAKSTSIAALRKEMLKELDRLKKFMSDQQ
jgi:hypothetical protein